MTVDKFYAAVRDPTLWIPCQLCGGSEIFADLDFFSSSEDPLVREMLLLVKVILQDIGIPDSNDYFEAVSLFGSLLSLCRLDELSPRELHVARNLCQIYFKTVPKGESPFDVLESMVMLEVKDLLEQEIEILPRAPSSSVLLYFSVEN